MSVTKSIAEYMNSKSNKEFSSYEVSAIRTAIKKEAELRKEQGIQLNAKTKEGRKQLNIRTAAIVKDEYGFKINHEDVHLYKRCFAEEYQDRTGKCMWGFKEKRKELGYDPDTGLEVG